LNPLIDTAQMDFFERGDSSGRNDFGPLGDLMLADGAQAKQ
jgi:hypothetical protein